AVDAQVVDGVALGRDGVDVDLAGVGDDLGDFFERGGQGFSLDWCVLQRLRRCLIGFSRQEKAEMSGRFGGGRTVAQKTMRPSTRRLSPSGATITASPSRGETPVSAWISSRCVTITRLSEPEKSRTCCVI